MKKLNKERGRRRKLRRYVLYPSKDFEPTQANLAEYLECSQSTVSRDLKKLASSRWNPFRELKDKVHDEISKKQFKSQEEHQKYFEDLSFKEKLEYLGRLTSISSGNRLYPKNSKSRGRPFRMDYQPRLGQWGIWPFHCLNCGCKGRVEINGNWQRGERAEFNCPECDREVGVTRPELPIERRTITSPCGYLLEISTRGRWDKNLYLLFDCPKCGKEHRIEKQFTRPITKKYKPYS